MITKGKWELTKHRPLDNIVIAVKNGEEDYLDDTICQMSAYKTANEDAEFIVSACNACKEINPEHPESVAKHLIDMYRVLQEANLQIEYLDCKYAKTGTSQAILTRIADVLSKIKGGE